MNILKALIPVIAFAINVFTQIFTVRYMKSVGLFKSIVLGFFIGMVTLFSADIYFYSLQVNGLIFTIIADMITFTALGYGYFHFLNLGETARRVRLLMEIKETKKGLTLDEILLRYNAKEMVEKRLGRLLTKDQVRLEGGRYYLGKPLVFMMAKIMVFMKLFVLGKRSEFE